MHELNGMATDAYNSYHQYTKELDQVTQQILNLQQKTGIELVNNIEFDQWISTFSLLPASRHLDDAEIPLPTFNDNMVRIFGDPQHPGKGAVKGNIRTKEAMKEAIFSIAQYKMETDPEFYDSADYEQPNIDR